MSTQFFCDVDLAKQHFSLHAVDDHGKVILHNSFPRRSVGTNYGPVTGLAGSGETAVRDLLYVFAVSNDLMAEMTERSRRLCCSRALAAAQPKKCYCLLTGEGLICVMCVLKLF